MKNVYVDKVHEMHHPFVLMFFVILRIVVMFLLIFDTPIFYDYHHDFEIMAYMPWKVFQIHSSYYYYQTQIQTVSLPNI